MRIAVRTDASVAIGLGHVKRCLALAQALRAQGAEVGFFAARTDVDVASLVAGDGFACHGLDTPLDPGAMGRALAAWPAQAVVVDHYQIDAHWHDAVRLVSGAAIAVIDDLADRPLSCEVLIDHNPARDHLAKYRPVLRHDTRLCTGPRYALLDAVYRDHARCDPQAALTSLAIFMGGSDPLDHSRLVWRACREVAQWRGPIELATTSANPHLAGLRALAVSDPLLTLAVDLPHLADFHARHGLQVGAGGGALWERCCLGVPTLAMVCADNQRQSVPLLAEAGVVQAFDATPPHVLLTEPLGQAIAGLIDDAAQRAELHRRSLAWVDGRGAERAAQAVLQTVVASHPT